MIKPIHLLLLLAVASWLFAGAARAESNPDPAPEAARTQEQARQLREEANAIRRAAEAEHASAQTTCWDRFLVSSCLADAAKALREQKSRAYLMDREAREIEREIRKRAFAEREAKRREQAEPPTSDAQ